MGPPPPLLLSPSQLAYLHTSLSLQPPVRPDARTPTTFRSLRAETDFLPAANGSARVCFAEGGEAVVGIRAEVEPTVVRLRRGEKGGDEDEDEDDGGGGGGEREGNGGEESWVEVAIEQREDEAEAVFLAEMLREGLLADADGGGLKGRLAIGRRWHWRLFVDIVLLSPASTYPLPLLSLTTHLALLSCRLPALTSSSVDDDPLFNDDWDAAIPLYPFTTTPSSTSSSSQPQNKQQRRAKPPITLLVISVGENIFFDPSSEELAVADAVVAISVGQVSNADTNDATHAKGRRLKLLALRTIDPPSRQFAAASATEGGAKGERREKEKERAGIGEGEGKGEGEGEGIWKKRMGGMKRGLVTRMIKMVLEGGVGADVFRGLENWT